MCNHQERIDDLSFAARHAPYEMLERRGFAAHPCAARRLQLTSRGTSRRPHAKPKHKSDPNTHSSPLPLSSGSSSRDRRAPAGPLKKRPRLRQPRSSAGAR